MIIQHGVDMLVDGDDSSTLLCMPAPPGVFSADVPATGPLNPASPSDTGHPVSPRSRQSHSDIHMYLESDVCLNVSIVHWINPVAGAPNPGRAQVHVQVRPVASPV